MYRAEQPILAREVAIKVLHRALADDARIARHFRTEAIAAARFSHPNSVAVIDYGESDDGMPFLVMEYVHGRTLSQIVRDEAPLDVGRAIAITTQILDALGDAHALGIVHADVKSDNVLVESTRDRGEQAKLVDFGLARISSDPGDGPQGFDDDSFISGTPEYMAPEVIGGAAPSPASDLYAVGATLYELLTGSTPFAGGSQLEIMRRHLEDVVVPPSLRSPELHVPAHVERAILRALEKDPARRFATAAELAAELSAEVAAPAPPRPRRCVAPRMVGADEVPTLVLPTPSTVPERPSLARGSGALAPAEVAVRRQIGAAIRRGTINEVATGYLALAELLRGLNRPRTAVTELEEALDVLGAGPASGEEPTELVLMAMVTLYRELGDHAAAARTSRALDDRSTLTMSRP